MDLFLELVDQTAVKAACVLFFGRDHAGVGFFDGRRVGAEDCNDIVGYASSKNLSNLFGVLSIPPQYGDRRGSDSTASDFRNYRTCFQIVGPYNNWINLVGGALCYLPIKTE